MREGKIKYPQYLHRSLVWSLCLESGLSQIKVEQVVSGCSFCIHILVISGCILAQTLYDQIHVQLLLIMQLEIYLYSIG